MNKKYQICKRCIMDTTDPDIVFDENGVCNHCTEYFERENKILIKGEVGRKKFKEIIEKIKKDGKNKKYDCILGVSGGTDSSFVAYLAKQNDLNVLLVNLNNGYDTTIAQKNIENIVKKTGFNLYNYEVNFDEFSDLQLAYFKASVVDIEVASDHAIAAAIYEVANKNGIKYILSGTNFVTEGIMPKSWNYRKNDLRNLKDIHKKFGKIKLKSYPTMGIFKWIYYRYLEGIQLIEVLNYIEYNKEEVKKILHREFGWEDYGGKHYESRFTRFYQTYILPTKFSIDKRKAHLSTLICSGQITREKALKELEKPLYAKEEFEADKEYVLDKLDLSVEEFETLMELPPKNNSDYATDEWIYSKLNRFKN